MASRTWNLIIWNWSMDIKTYSIPIKWPFLWEVYRHIRFQYGFEFGFSLPLSRKIYTSDLDYLLKWLFFLSHISQRHHAYKFQRHTLTLCKWFFFIYTTLETETERKRKKIMRAEKTVFGLNCLFRNAQGHFENVRDDVNIICCVLHAWILQCNSNEWF